MAAELKTYTYNGPVEVFGKCVEHFWKAETMATSKDKARSNLTYQYKKLTGRPATCKVALLGKITEE